MQGGGFFAYKQTYGSMAPLCHTWNYDDFLNWLCSHRIADLVIILRKSLCDSYGVALFDRGGLAKMKSWNAVGGDT